MEIPSISIVVPAYNAGAYLPITLPVLRSIAKELAAELLMVNDGSGDDSLDVARQLDIRVVDTDGPLGAARARNLGVEHTRGETLVFVDADVSPLPGAITGLLAHVRSGEYTAAFGSYDVECPARNFASRYQNLRHYYYHQRGAPEADSFWCGLGVIERRAFVEAGGLDPEYEGIEDLELGARLRRAGHRIRLDPDRRGIHLKRWTLAQALHTDIVKRALPWSRLLSRADAARPTLNTAPVEKLRAVAALMLLGTTAAALTGWAHGLVPLSVGFAATLLNLPFLLCMAKLEGVPFALAATLYHQLYYIYSSAVYLYCRIEAIIAARLLKAPDADDKAGSTCR